jgi:hypothetical protein
VIRSRKEISKIPFWFSRNSNVQMNARFASATEKLTINAKQLIVGLVWLGFTALTIAIFALEGSAALAIPYPRLASIGATVDLFIQLVLVSIWMYFDARKRGKSAIPFILMALVLGSLGPLTYLFLRLGDSRAEPIFRFEHRPLGAK